MSHRRGLTPAFLGVLVALGALGASWAVGAADQRPAHADLEAIAASTAAAVDARLAADGQLLAAASQAIGGDPTRSDDVLVAALTSLSSGTPVVAPNLTLGVVRTRSTASARIAVVVPEAASASAVGFDLATQPAFKRLLDVTRDSGGAEVATGAGPDGHVTVIETAALFGTSTVPDDVASRRSALVGYVVLILPQADRFGLPASPSDPDLVVRVVDDTTTVATSGRQVAGAPPASGVTIPISVSGSGWTVQVWSVATPSGSRWIVLAFGLLLALAVTTLAERRERLVERAVRDAEDRAQELALVARAGPLLQQSLASSDLLPVFAVTIADDLELDAVSISLITDAGRLVRVFSLGADPTPLDSDASSLSMPSGGSAPGSLVTVPLLRAGRVVGALRARATPGLSASQVETLVAVCNLLAAALGNARLLQDEQELVTRLRDVDRMKTTFVSSVSHELRTTVTAIEGFAGLLDGDVTVLDDDRRRDYIERIRRNARSLGVLIEDLLDFARFERSAITVDLRPIDLSELVPQVVDQMSSLLADHEISVDVAPAVTALGELSAVERVLVNLLSNAAKYTPAGTKVDVILRRKDDRVVLWVEDHGPGVPEDQREKVFELFYRFHDRATTATRGVGIGLALARQLIAQLDGTITLSETRGGGASFRVEMPSAEVQPSSTTPNPSPSTGSRPS
ncbi:MAG TPA: ATP-binding protein [Acidimicrobiales bacterium]|nr:ATP-binding protein [Acidimicrobiales bacterium]